MVAGLEPVVAFWTGWGLHFVVLVSFTVQVTLLLLADLRRRKDWALLKVVIWSAYMLADTTAIYALGHMSVLCHWSPEQNLMALWAPLLLVHLGGQDNITAYAIEDNRLWLRHLQNFALQVAAVGYVLYVSGILFHGPSELRSAAILMSVVGVVKYGERIWALILADRCASSSLSAMSYDKVSGSHISAGGESNLLAREMSTRNQVLIIAYSLLDVAKQMFEGPTSYVQLNELDKNEAFNKLKGAEERMVLDAVGVVELQVGMMYELLYTKAPAVVHTWYGLGSRLLIALPFTTTALLLFRRSSSTMSHAAAAGGYRRADVAITSVLLIGAVVVETFSVLRAIFSKWTGVLLYARGWNTIGNMVFRVTDVITDGLDALLLRSQQLWSARMRQHSIFKLSFKSHNSTVRKMAKWMGVEDWWDSNVYSWSTQVHSNAVAKVLVLVSSTTAEDMARSQGLNAIQRRMNNEQAAAWIWTTVEDLKLEERILVWHIATHVYIRWCTQFDQFDPIYGHDHGIAALQLANYMFYLLAARPYMLPYPVSRRPYVQLCSDVVTHLSCFNERHLLMAVLNQKEALMENTPLQPDGDIQRRQVNKAAQPASSMNRTLDRGCQLAAKLIHITDSEKAKKAKTFQTEIEAKVRVQEMVLDVWTEMLCYTASLCNENYHAKHLTDGGDILTYITLFMIYENALKSFVSALISQDIATAAAGPSSSQGARATAAAGPSSSETNATEIEYWRTQ